MPYLDPWKELWEAFPGTECEEFERHWTSEELTAHCSCSFFVLVAQGILVKLLSKQKLCTFLKACSVRGGIYNRVEHP